MVTDQSVSIHPYFVIRPGYEDHFRKVCDQFIAKASQEQGCLNYGFSFAGTTAFCRETYVDAEAALFHLNNVADEIQQALEFSELTRLEIHGSADQLAILEESVSALNPVLFTLEQGFRTTPTA